METINKFLFTFLVNACWQIPVVTLVAFLVRRLIKDAPARYEHLLWVMALLLCLILPLISLKSSIQTTTIVGSWTTGDSIANNLADKSRPVQIAQSGSMMLNTIKSWFHYFTISTHISLLLIGTYLLFICYQVVRLIRAWRKTLAIKNSAYECELSEEVVSILDICRKELKVNKVRLLCSNYITSPLTLGTKDPLIILPEKLFNEASAEILLSTFGHELAHIKRNDYLYNLVYEFLYLPISFHPLTNFIKRRLVITRELACDETVVDRFIDATAYADSILTIAKNIAITNTHKYSLGIFDAGNLEERIMKLVNKEQLSKKMGQLLLVACVMVMLVSGWTTSAFSFNPPADKVAIVLQLGYDNGSMTLTKEDDDNLLTRPGMLDAVMTTVTTLVSVKLDDSYTDATLAALTKSAGHNIKMHTINDPQQLSLDISHVRLGDVLRFLDDNIGEPQVDNVNFKDINKATKSLVDTKFSISFTNAKIESVVEMLSYFSGQRIKIQGDLSRKVSFTASNTTLAELITALTQSANSEQSYQWRIIEENGKSPVMERVWLGSELTSNSTNQKDRPYTITLDK